MVIAAYSWEKSVDGISLTSALVLGKVQPIILVVFLTFLNPDLYICRLSLGRFERQRSGVRFSSFAICFLSRLLADSFRSGWFTLYLSTTRSITSQAFPSPPSQKHSLPWDVRTLDHCLSTMRAS